MDLLALLKIAPQAALAIVVAWQLVMFRKEVSMSLTEQRKESAADRALFISEAREDRRAFLAAAVHNREMLTKLEERTRDRYFRNGGAQDSSHG